ncbi:hypothetical protein [Vibrio sp. 03_296]|uniref:hypothetical protein n=1 Tax=Vibrio sp. 03_296 TaxID=2024409 RepID=UPI002D7F7506|nr:hypothetical protein [Vibrio sp. 03_296]
MALQRVVGSSLSVTEQFIDETGRVKLWNKANRPFCRSSNLQRLWLMAALCFFGVATPAAAEGFLCEATQASTNELPMLDKACPIGECLGKKRPKAAKRISLDSMWHLKSANATGRRQTALQADHHRCVDET